MEKEYPHSFQSSMVVFVYVLLICLVLCAAEEISTLDRQLSTIRYSQRNDDTNVSILETECLNLVADHNAPSDKGKIYATIASAYSDRGYGPDDDPNRPARTYQYAMMALEYPLEPLTACYMYTRGSDGVMAQSWHDPNIPFIEARDKAAELCLKGLKLALDNDAPKEFPPSLGPVARFGVGPGTPLEGVIRWHNRQIEAREKWLCEAELYGLRQGLFKRCVFLCSRKPHDREAFKNKAKKILKGHEGIVNELISALKAAEGAEGTEKITQTRMNTD